MPEVKQLGRRTATDPTVVPMTVAIPGPPEVPMMTWPFDHDSTDEDIEAVLTHSIGATITWHNAAGNHTATLIQFRQIIRHPIGGTYIDILCNPGGFRAMYVDQIDSIGQ